METVSYVPHSLHTKTLETQLFADSVTCAHSTAISLDVVSITGECESIFNAIDRNCER